VRLPRRVGGREPGDALPHEKGGLLGAQDFGRGPHDPAASRTLGIASEAKRRVLASDHSWVILGRRPQK
jgi:hypothetical protein